MTLLSRFTGGVLIIGAVTASACGDDAAGTGGSAGSGGEGGGTSTQGFPFAPSNLPVGFVPGFGSSVRFPASCGMSGGFIDTTDDRFSDCAEIVGNPQLVRMTQPAGGEIDVLVVDEFSVASGVQILLYGDRPLLVMAKNEIVIEGSIDAISDGLFPSPGGAMPGDRDGNGLGAGTGTSESGASGASFCGIGGKGASTADEPGGEPRSSYGNAELVPLQGGSSGGKAENAFSFGGTGGGALQLVAGVRVRIAAGARINVGGGGADGAAAGGGSGGALLVESMQIELDGVVAANGGAGSSAVGQPGEHGLASGEAAPGGTTESECDVPGGVGSAATTTSGADGMPGEPDCGQEASGGGGGAGRIRFNTPDGTFSPNGLVSPSLDSDCGTVGKLVLVS
jgi:hypothetical protein